MRSIALAASFMLLAPLLATSAARADDTTPPVIEHTPVTKADKGAVVQVFAKITDESKFFPQVFFRYDSSSPFEKPVDMKQVKGKKNQFGANIPNKGPYVEYYLEAYDEFGNGPGRAGAPEAPFKVDLSGGEAVVVKKEPEPEAAPAPKKRPVPPPAATANASEGQSRTATWIVGGTGLGLLVGGLMAGLAVKTADTAYQNRLRDPQNNPTTLQAQYDANKSLGTKATILTIAGGVLLAGGVALYFLEPTLGGPKGTVAGLDKLDKTDDTVRVAAIPLDNGGAVAVAGRF